MRLFVALAALAAVAHGLQTLEEPHVYATRLNSECGLDMSFVRHAVSTVQVGTAAVDCVPFHHQPNVPESGDMKMPSRTPFGGKHGDAVMPSMASQSACPDGSVPVARFTRCPPPKKAPTSPSPDATGFEYVIPNDVSVPGSNESFVLLSGGVNEPLAKCANNGQCHSLNQLWWTTTESARQNLSTLETGHIASNYFTSEVTTSIFAFSTNDDYKGDKADGYNLNGGFTMYPSSPVTLGAPMDKVQLQLSYVMDEQSQAYVLWSRGFSQSASGVYSATGSWEAVGYYDFSRYSSGTVFDTNQAGSEVYHTTNEVTMAGRILGWGTNLALGPTQNAFFDQPQGSGFYAKYKPSSWSPAYGLAAPTQVVFGGSPPSS